MNKKIKALLLGLLLTVILYLSVKLRNDQANRIKANHYDVIGTVSNVGWKTIDISYAMNGSEYTYTMDNPYKGIAEGEQFYTMAGKQDPETVIVFYTNPILDTTRYKFALVKATGISKLFIDQSELSFSYEVGTEEFSRIQKYEDGKRPENTDKLKVKYRIDKPEIGYLVE